MKLNKWIYGAMAVGMLAACSNDDMPSNGGGEVVSREGKYLSVNINLPTVPSTRALNDDYADGTADEYAVQNACLVIFTGSNEETAKFAAAYNLAGLGEVGGVDGDNITTSYKKTVRLDNLTTKENDKLYAFAMLNYTSVATVEKDNGLTLNGKPVTRGADGTDFATLFYDVTASTVKFYQTNTKTSGEVDEYFFMCNAPLSINAGSDADISPVPTTDAVDATTGCKYIRTLVWINSDNLGVTEAEAEAKEACSINVERGVAKATIKWTPEKFADGSSVGSKMPDTMKPSFSVIGWTLDVTEPTSFIARKATAANEWWAYNNAKAVTDKYRFIGDAKIGKTAIQEDQNLYRTYWCLDPTYSNDLVPNPNNVVENGDNSNEGGSTKLNEYKVPSEFYAENRPLYCYENTFDVAHQNYRNTTRAVFQTKLSIGGKEPKTFYVMNGDETTLYTDSLDVDSYPKQIIVGSGRITNALNKAVGDVEPGQKVEWSGDDAKAIVIVKMKRNETTGVREVVDIEFDPKQVGEDKIFKLMPVLSDDDKKFLINNANVVYVITEYKDGACYYDYRFMHFASDDAAKDLAPWSTESPIATTTSVAYGTNANDYLGRYGMVRNNWYDVEITSVKKLGSPVVPDITGEKGDTSDDSKERYLSFKINVLSWAKRTQKHEF